MTDKYFLDTNILVYMFSRDDPEKKEICFQYTNELDANGQIFWSTQVIQEFYSILTKKFDKDPLEVKASISDLGSFHLITNNLETIQHAIDIQILNKISFGDALIISAAKQANCNYLLSEDLGHGQLIAGIRVVSPFDKMDF